MEKASIIFMHDVWAGTRGEISPLVDWGSHKSQFKDLLDSIFLLRLHTINISKDSNLISCLLHYTSEATSYI